MKGGYWNRLGRILARSGIVLLLLGGPARGQDNELEELRSRLEKLEREHKELQKIPRHPSASDPALSPRLSETDVKKIAGDYLKDKADQKQKEEEAKKNGAAQEGYEVGSDLKLGASWNNGLLFQTENKDFRINIGGKFDDHWVFFNEPPALKGAAPVGVGTLNDGTFVRRAKLQAYGTAYEVYEFFTVLDFENINLVTLDDFWFGITQLPCIGTVRVGEHKVPQGLESYTYSPFLTFIERAAPYEAFLQEYAPGVFASNNPFDQRMTWAAMFYRCPTPNLTGIDAGNNVLSGADFGNGEYAATGRISVLPYYENDGRCLLHLAGSYSYRESKWDAANGRDVFQFRTRSEIRDSNTFVGNSTRFIDTGIFQCDNTQIVGAEVLGIYGPFSVQSEWFGVFAEHAATLPPAGQKPLGDLFFQGWYVQASYFLTGENRVYDRRFGRMDRVKPFTNFWWVRTDDGCCRGGGAWEIALRYSLVDLNDAAFEPPGAGGTGGQLQEYTVGLNWYLNPSMKVQWNYVRANRDVNNPYHSGNVDEFGMNFHIDF